MNAKRLEWYAIRSDINKQMWNVNDGHEYIKQQTLDILNIKWTQLRCIVFDMCLQTEWLDSLLRGTEFDPWTWVAFVGLRTNVRTSYVRLSHAMDCRKLEVCYQA